MYIEIFFWIVIFKYIFMSIKKILKLNFKKIKKMFYKILLKRKDLYWTIYGFITLSDFDMT